MLHRKDALLLKHQALVYRQQGYSYSMIGEKLGVAKSTLSYWLEDVPYLPNAEVVKRISEAPAKSRATLKLTRLNNITEARRQAYKELGRISNRDLWMLGIGLYMGEGSKCAKPGTIQIVNSDPKIIKLSIAWFKYICKLDQKNLKISVHTHPDKDIKHLINYWSVLTGVPKNQFGKTIVDFRTNKSKANKRTLPYGTVRLTIRSNGVKKNGVQLLRRILGWIEAAEKQVNAGVVQW